MIRGEIREKTMAFGQGVFVTGGYRFFPAVQCGATMTTALTDQPRFFAAPISTYTRVHKQFAPLVFCVTFPLALSLQR